MAMQPSSPTNNTLFVSLLLLHFLMLRPSSATAQTYRNMSLGTTLTPLGPNSTWSSPSGDFAFGFIDDPSNSSGFLLAIWFAKTVSKTIIWTARGDRPVLAASKFELTSNGRLALTDQTGAVIWSPAATGSAHAAMLDTGNLVLIDDGSSEAVWQSFNSPTDTIVPTQVIGLGGQLRSRASDFDYSSGRFVLNVQLDGNLVMYPIAVPESNFYGAYWATSTVGSGTRLAFNSSGIVFFELQNGTRINVTTAGIGSSEGFYQRATMDPDGVFRHYVYPKDKKGSWEEGWTGTSHAPAEDICLRIRDDVGSGVCGFNSYCTWSESKPASCGCPDGYSYLDSKDERKGCKPDFAPQRCDIDESEKFELRTMPNADWPLSDYEHFTGVIEDKCREYCLMDCFCAVAVFRGGECWKKRLPLSNGRFGNYGSGNALIKVPKNGTSEGILLLNNNNVTVVKKDQNTLIIVGYSILAGSLLVNFLLVTLVLAATCCFSSNQNPQLQKDANASLLNLRGFTYEQLQEATNGFSEEIGSGGFGTVYKGCLRMEETQVCVAVKKLRKLSEEAEKEFMAEVRSIGQTHHKNLVRLFGFCNEGQHRLLVYEFMSNGSLTSFVFGAVKPDWNTRVQIIFCVARGLSYLHEECINPIIHCDIKTQNILLDHNFVARISDFGLAKLLKADQTRTNTGIRGTKGYVAPEWFKSMPITTKVDVYSFGVLLLEIISCRRNLEQEIANEEASVLVFWAYDCYRDRRLDLMVASNSDAMTDMARVERFVMVAIWCIQEDPSLRPSMHKVTQMLEGSVPVSVPPDPSSYISSIP